MALKLLASTADIEEGEFAVSSVDDTDIIVGKADGRFFAIEDLCPHAYVTISYGWLEGCELTCPWHGFTFDVHSGECTSWPEYDGLNRLPVEVNEGKIYLREPSDQSD